jgi:hypothetical protein
MLSVEKRPQGARAQGPMVLAKKTGESTLRIWIVRNHDTCSATTLKKD